MRGENVFAAKSIESQTLFAILLVLLFLFYYGEFAGFMFFVSVSGDAHA